MENWGAPRFPKSSQQVRSGHGPWAHGSESCCPDENDETMDEDGPTQRMDRMDVVPRWIAELRVENAVVTQE